MSRRWPPGTLKIHEGCGGRVRWVEAVDTPGVGYHGECLACGDDRLPVEYIIPIETADGEEPHELYPTLDRDTLASLSWELDCTWQANQDHLRSELGVDG